MHSMLHDRDDWACMQILRRLRAAMTAGVSKLLVQEPVVGAHLHVTSIEWLMMASGAVRGRTEAEWRGMLGRAGFKVGKVWAVEEEREGLIEAVDEGDRGCGGWLLGLEGGVEGVDWRYV